ncbi:hypothetical protein MITS9509_01774 [Synechococcus sp. MIT S9509]|nr:hypothetical protein MITS9509_01774 [Synechococcus sp. MIT S9509]
MNTMPSKRSAGARFGPSDSPGARRLEVWLQPRTIELLDTLAQQWGVARGKVIDQLLTGCSASPAQPPRAERHALKQDRLDRSEFYDRDAARLQARRWEICRKDASDLPGVTAKQINIFKIEQKMNRDQPLSDAGKQALLDLIEHHRRQVQEEAALLAEHIQRMKQRATPDRLRAIDGAVESAPQMTTRDAAARFLLTALATVGLNGQDRIDERIWSELEDLIPYAKVFDFTSGGSPEDNVIRRCLFWGVALRLATLEGDPPQDTAECLAWCGFAVHQSEQARNTAQWWSELTDRMAGRPGSEADRRLLGLPAEGNLTVQTIKAAYKLTARKAHPDLGGTAEQMTQIIQAKDRLIQALEQ